MKKIDLVVTKTPLRVSLLGGGTDMKYFYKNYGGSVLNCAIDKYVYVTVKRHSPCFNEKYRLNYSKSETKNKLNKIENNIVRECIKLTKIDFPIYISTVGDVPAGSGLGGSSSFTVGLLKALYTIQGKKINKERLFQESCKIEIDILNQPIGKQDQVPAVFGGLNFINFKKNDTIKVIKIKKNKIHNIFSKSLLIWTQSTRSASEVLKNQKKNLKSNIKRLKKIKENADTFYQGLKLNKKFDLKKLGNLVNNSWQEKKKLSAKISIKKIDKLINIALRAGCYGSKLLGAGSGGFIIIFGEKKHINSIMHKNKNLVYLKFNLSNKGSEVISIV
tara:strand:+ start:1528 stop:2523 length:996 start_codon:yes stop_codon:yes gene_type:complete